MAGAVKRTARSRDPHAPLAGATIVVTRPAGTAASLTREVSRRGGRPLRLPGLSLRPIPDPAPGAARSKDRFADWIFTSPAAVRFGAKRLPALRRRPRARIFAIGNGTARALARHGLEAIVPERVDSEGLLALPDLRRVRGRRVALVGAPGGRDLIAPALRRRGAEVEPIHVYRRVPPRLTKRHFDALDAAVDPLLALVSSGEALANLVALLPPRQLERLRAQTLVVSSSRLAALARSHRFGAIVLARSAAPRDLLAAAEGALARHRL